MQKKHSHNNISTDDMISLKDNEETDNLQDLFDIEQLESDIYKCLCEDSEMTIEDVITELLSTSIDGGKKLMGKDNAKLSEGIVYVFKKMEDIKAEIAEEKRTEKYEVEFIRDFESEFEMFATIEKADPLGDVITPLNASKIIDEELMGHYKSYVEVHKEGPSDNLALDGDHLSCNLCASLFYGICSARVVSTDVCGRCLLEYVKLKSASLAGTPVKRSYESSDCTTSCKKRKKVAKITVDSRGKELHTK